MFSLSHSLTFMTLIQLQPSTTMPETHSLSCFRDIRIDKLFATAKSLLSGGCGDASIVYELVGTIKRSLCGGARASHNVGSINNSNDFNHGGKPVPDPNQEGDGKTEAVQEEYDEERDPPVVDKDIPAQDPNQDQGDGKATEDTVERSKLLISISVAILIILTTSGILVGSTGSRLFTASSFRSHKAMYISIYTVYALDFILTIISILLCVIKPYCRRPCVHTVAGYLVVGSLILLLVVMPLGACAQFISSDQTSSPPPPPPPGLLHHQLKRIPGS